MAQLDRFLSAMVSHRASALRLDETALAELEIAGAARPVTKAPLTAVQVVSLLREIAPAAASEALAAGQSTAFDYVSDEGAFAIDAKRDGGRWQVRITIDAGRERDRLVDHARDLGGVRGAASEAPAAAHPTPSSSNASLRLVTSTHGAISADADAIAHFDGSDRARAMLDALLRAMVEKGASDLHLRCGEPPILRLHGEMSRLDEPPLEPLWLDAMLRSIMPERNRREYSESNDTDYAYELEGIARFRANALKDRRGPAAVFRQIPATVVTVEQMGITPEVQKLCQLNKGLVLVTGPTGSGKSTTLCSLIDLVNRSRSDHVITIEDPIEFVHPNKKCIITQRQVGVHTGSFKSALRAALREDPDIILVGELRDLDGGDGTPRLRHAAHDHRRGHDRPHHRSVPGRSAVTDPRHARRIAQGR